MGNKAVNKIGELPSIAKSDYEDTVTDLTEKIKELDEMQIESFIAGLITEPSIAYWESPDKVDFGLFSDGRLYLCDGYCPRWSLLEHLRVFNEAEELHIWRYSRGLAARLASDTISEIDEDNLESGNCLVQTSKLWGSSARPYDNGIMLFEDRGMKIWLPIPFEDHFAGGDTEDGGGINAFIQERHYLKDNERTGQVNFVDRRFVKVLIADKDGKLGEREVIKHG